jgi:hypothetical protein
MFLINTKFCLFVSFEKMSVGSYHNHQRTKVLIKKHKIIAGAVVSLHTCRNRHKAATYLCTSVIYDMRQHPIGALIVNARPIHPSG